LAERKPESAFSAISLNHFGVPVPARISVAYPPDRFN
jgi:hypothetical protein